METARALKLGMSEANVFPYGETIQIRPREIAGIMQTPGGKEPVPPQLVQFFSAQAPGFKFAQNFEQEPIAGNVVAAC